MTTWRIALLTAAIPALLGASSLLTACNDDTPTPPWLPNYTDSGYGGAKGGSGGAGGGAGASTAGGGGTKAGAAGEGAAEAGAAGAETAGAAGAAQ